MTKAPRGIDRTAIRLTFLFSLTFATGGCGDTQYSEDESIPGAASDSLNGAAVAKNAYGVVDFTSDITNGCTGTLIAPNAILTAAHCFEKGGAGAGTQSGTSNFDIFYYRYYGDTYERVNILSGPAQWHVYPSYRQAVAGYLEYLAYAPTDTALIVAANPFRGTNYHDYLRLYADADGPLEQGRRRVYGAGMYNQAGDDDLLLREALYDVESVEGGLITLDNSSDVGVCYGDSGGPVMKHATRNGQDFMLLVGDAALMDNAGNYCTTSYPLAPDNAYYSRTTDKINWIESVLHRDCLKTSGGSNLIFERCFDLPLIEDVYGEGRTQGQGAAIFSAL